MDWWIYFWFITRVPSCNSIWMDGWMDGWIDGYIFWFITQQTLFHTMWVVKPSCCAIFLMVTRKEWQSSQKGQLALKKKKKKRNQWKWIQDKSAGKISKRGWERAALSLNSFFCPQWIIPPCAQTLDFALAGRDWETPYLVAYSLSALYSEWQCVRGHWSKDRSCTELNDWLYLKAHLLLIWKQSQLPALWKER